jgi:D-alanine-D-alanine ligase
VSDDLRAAVLAGGLTYERDVSLKSGRRVADALRRAGVEAQMLDTDAQMIDNLLAIQPDAVFVALHGGSGEDGALRSVLDLLGLPYVGSSADACRLAWDKPAAKALVAQHGVRTPDSLALPHSTFRELGASALLDRIVGRLGLPLMVKPAQGGSALGAQQVTAVDQLPAAMISCFSYGGTALVEPHIAGVQVAVSVLDTGDGPRALPAVEVVPASGLFDYTARYTPGATTYHTPARVDPAVAEELAALAVTVHTVLSLRDLSRVDAIVSESGEIEFLQVNVAPGMTETSLLPMAVKAAGIDVGAALADLLRQAARRGGDGRPADPVTRAS